MKETATNRTTYQGRQRNTGDNSVYVEVSGEVANRRSVCLANFVVTVETSSSNPLLGINT